VRVEPHPGLLLLETGPAPARARVAPSVIHEPPAPESSFESVDSQPRWRWLSADRIVQACSALGLVWALALLSLILLR
jgi:hypothetical protein